MKRFLPLGSVVKLDIALNEKLMIFARMAKQNEEDDFYFDYCACKVPQGYTRDDELKLFNHADIEQLLFIGLQDEEELQYAVALAEEVAKLRKE